MENLKSVDLEVVSCLVRSAPMRTTGMTSPQLQLNGRLLRRAFILHRKKLGLSEILRRTSLVRRRQDFGFSLSLRDVFQ